MTMGHAYPRILPLLCSVLLACEIHPFENAEPPTLSDLQVGPGVTPTFSWTGDEADQLVVRRDGEAVWLVTDHAGMPSPITYGIPPSGADEHIRVEAVLTAGVTYDVEVMAYGFLTQGASVKRSFTPVAGLTPPP